MKAIIPVLAAIVLCSCTKTECGNAPAQYDGLVPVEVHLSVPEATTTRSFFVDAEALEAAEARIETVQIGIFGPTGWSIGDYRFEVDQVQNRRVTVWIPEQYLGKTCNIYVFCNNGFSRLSSESSWAGMQFVYSRQPQHKERAEDMLGPDDPVAFWMGGFTSYTVERMGSAHVDLTRVQAKVASRLRIDENFSANHGGAKLRITRVELRNQTNFGYGFPGHSPSNNTHITATQIPLLDGDYHCNLFYCFPRNSYSLPELAVHGIYDRDGDFSTTDDQSEVEMTTPVTKSSSVDRNTYYRVEGVIRGVNVRDCEIRFEADPWVSTPVHYTFN